MMPIQTELQCHSDGRNTGQDTALKTELLGVHAKSDCKHLVNQTEAEQIERVTYGQSDERKVVLLCSIEMLLQVTLSPIGVLLTIRTRGSNSDGNYTLFGRA